MKIQFKEKEIEVNQKITIAELLKEEIENSRYQVVGATFNNEYQNLNFEIEHDGKIELIDISTKEGMKIYRRTLIYIMEKAFEECYPKLKVFVNYQLSNSMFCDIEDTQITVEMLNTVKVKMKEIIEKNLEIKRVVMNRKEAEEFYEKNNTYKGRLQFDIKNNKEIYMYYCEGYYNYCYGTLANKTGATQVFDIVKYTDGFLLRYPNSNDPTSIQEYHETKKLAWALDEYDEIHKVLNVNTIYKLNKIIDEGKIKDIIMLEEALHEKKIAGIADKIAKNKNVKMVLIAGPSSSGKTTFAQRLGIQLRLNRLKPVTISVDNYFVERSETPKNEEGEYDFECIEAIDLNLLNDHLTKLLNGEEIEMPELAQRDIMGRK